ncbi:MAG: hypothetical protein ACK4SM_01190 [Aquificaceae bacterium]
MRFYGIASEERVKEIIESIEGGVWFFEDTKQGLKERLNHQEAKERLKKILLEIQNWKSSMSLLPKSTIFVFVHEPSCPKAFKIYDTTSLGCSSELTPPRWKVYIDDVIFIDRI